MNLGLERFWKKIWPGFLIFLLYTTTLFLGSNQVYADGPDPTPSPEEPVEWSTTTLNNATILSQAERPAKQNSKLGSSLNQLLATRQEVGVNKAEDFASQHMMVIREGRIEVEIIAAEETLSDLILAIEALGGEYQGHYQTLLQAMVPIENLESLSQRTDVKAIRNPVRPIPVEPVLAGTVNTEGLSPSNAVPWHSNGYTGTGVKIAVIDGGFTNYSSLLGSDLPASVIARDYTGSGMGGSPHGTACAEIVHDMAPGATMYLSKVGTVVNLANAVNDLIADNVDIISMSLGWTLDGPGDGTGYLADIVKDARDAGILFVTAAGNEAQVSWSGTYNNSGDTHLWDINQNVNYFGPGNSSSCYEIPAGYPIIVGLHWDDWTSVNQDYDMQLLRWTGSTWLVVAESLNDQAGSYPTPEEFIGVYAPYTACYGVVVRRYSATRDVCLRLIAPKMEHLDEWVTQRSLTFPADSPNAMTVAAVDVTSPFSLESYSSRGRTFGPGGTCSGGSMKPDIAGFANVSTVSYGPGGFNGTSSATPHVAGAAALSLNSYPTYTPAQLQSFLEDRAIDMGSSGKDTLYGSGRLYLGPPREPDVHILYLPLIFKACLPIGESNNVADALTVSSGQTVCGQVSDPTDLDDVYQIAVAAGQQLTISMNGSGGDADLYLYPPGTTDVYTDPYVDFSDNIGNNEFIQGIALVGGFWYIDVYSFSGTTNYNVTATLSSPSGTGIKTFNLTGTGLGHDGKQEK